MPRLTKAPFAAQIVLGGRKRFTLRINFPATGLAPQLARVNSTVTAFRAYFTMRFNWPEFVGAMPVDYFAGNLGTRAVIRECHPDDAPRLIDALASLSLETRMARFFFAKNQFTPDELAYLLNPDDQDHLIRAAVIPGGTGSEQIVGLARCRRVAANLPLADLGVVVADSWQRSGLGTRLLRELREGSRQIHITHWRADFFETNLGMTKLLARVGMEENRESLGEGVRRVTVRL
jgi:RimJ/RimL family protein N-acetyltransferase